MATILAHITVRPGTEAQFEELARRLYADTHGNETGVLRYEYWRGAGERSYYTLLSFTDFPTFIAHQTSPHHEHASPVLRTVIESIRLEWVDPVAGASPLPPTVPGEIPADADELTRTYADRFAMVLADWWSALKG